MNNGSRPAYSYCRSAFCSDLPVRKNRNINYLLFFYFYFYPQFWLAGTATALNCCSHQTASDADADEQRYSGWQQVVAERHVGTIAEIFITTIRVTVGQITKATATLCAHHRLRTAACHHFSPQAVTSNVFLSANKSK